MKETLHKLMSFVLALLVLGSTMSFSVAKHYCGEHLVDVAFFGDAKPCAMELALTAKYGEGHNKKSECCSDEKFILEGQDELKMQFYQFTFEKIVFLQTFTSSYVDIFEGLELQFVPLDGYPPPLIVANYQALFDQYLI